MDVYSLRNYCLIQVTADMSFPLAHYFLLLYSFYCSSRNKGTDLILRVFTNSKSCRLTCQILMSELTTNLMLRTISIKIFKKEKNQPDFPYLHQSQIQTEGNEPIDT